MDGKPLPELESFLTLDPKVPSPLLSCSHTQQLEPSPLLPCCHYTLYLGGYTAIKLRHVRRGTWRRFYELHMKHVRSKCCCGHVCSLHDGSEPLALYAGCTR